jgi:hypothetical protein
VTRINRGWAGIFILGVCLASCEEPNADPLHAARDGTVIMPDSMDLRKPRDMLGPRWESDSAWAADSVSHLLGGPAAGPKILEVCLSRAGAIFIAQAGLRTRGFWVPVYLDGFQRVLQPVPLQGPINTARDSLVRHAARAHAPDSSRITLRVASVCETRYGSAFYFLGEGILDWELRVWANGFDTLVLR